jgi:hypothetical protein
LFAFLLLLLLLPICLRAPSAWLLLLPSICAYT